jgi:hypothetical protein
VKISAYFRNISLLFIASGVGVSPLYCGHFWPIVPAPDDRWGWCGAIGGMKIGKGNRSTRRKTCPSATWPDLGSNPGRRDGKPATNRLNYGAAFLFILACWKENQLRPFVATAWKCRYICHNYSVMILISKFLNCISDHLWMQASLVMIRILKRKANHTSLSTAEASASRFMSTL